MIGRDLTGQAQEAVTAGARASRRHGTYDSVLAGLLIQSEGDPPDFVDPSWVREPDVIWDWSSDGGGDLTRKRRYDFAAVGDLPEVTVDEWVRAIQETGMRPERKRAAEVFARYGDRETGRNVRPSNGTLAKALGISSRRAGGHVRVLRDEGWVAPTGKARKGVIVYALTIPSDELAEVAAAA